MKFHKHKVLLLGYKKPSPLAQDEGRIVDSSLSEKAHWFQWALSLKKECVL